MVFDGNGPKGDPLSIKRSDVRFARTWRSAARLAETVAPISIFFTSIAGTCLGMVMLIDNDSQLEAGGNLLKALKERLHVQGSCRRRQAFLINHLAAPFTDRTR